MRLSVCIYVWCAHDWVDFRHDFISNVKSVKLQQSLTLLGRQCTECLYVVYFLDECSDCC